MSNDTSTRDVNFCAIQRRDSFHERTHDRWTVTNGSLHVRALFAVGAFLVVWCILDVTLRIRGVGVVKILLEMQTFHVLSVAFLWDFLAIKSICKATRRAKGGVVLKIFVFVINARGSSARQRRDAITTQTNVRSHFHTKHFLLRYAHSCITVGVFQDFQSIQRLQKRIVLTKPRCHELHHTIGIHVTGVLTQRFAFVRVLASCLFVEDKVKVIPVLHVLIAPRGRGIKWQYALNPGHFAPVRYARRNDVARRYQR